MENEKLKVENGGAAALCRDVRRELSGARDIRSR